MAYLVDDLHMIEDETSTYRFAIRILEQLLVQELLTLRLIGKDGLEVTKEG